MKTLTQKLKAPSVIATASCSQNGISSKAHNHGISAIALGTSFATGKTSWKA
jgi:hypothetical protein